MSIHEKMTIFYKKRNGEVVMAISGEQTSAVFGQDEEDFNQIYDYIVTEHDNLIIKQPYDFFIIEGGIKFKGYAEIEKYL